MSNQPLSNRAWRALDVVCKHDVDHRVEDQRRTIARLRREIDAINQRVEEMRRGEWLQMPHVWEGVVRRYPDFTPPESLRTAQVSLYDFLKHIVPATPLEIQRYP
jgi:hypothetical protein